VGEIDRRKGVKRCPSDIGKGRNMIRSRLGKRLVRLELAAEQPTEEPCLPVAPPAIDEAGVLAREVATAFGELVESFRVSFNLSHQDAVARADEPVPGVAERVLHCPPDQVSWIDLRDLSKIDPALALRRWEEMREAARAELRGGHRAATAIDGMDRGAWARARFLALRDELVEGWRPRCGLEWQLIDQMAQAQTMLWLWQEVLTTYGLLLGRGRERRQAARNLGPCEPPRQSDAEAAAQAAAMVDCWHRFYLRALKALQDQRRAGPRLVVRRAGQVNVAAQQMNVVGRG
jgi:hypothetical protein